MLTPLVRVVVSLFCELARIGTGLALTVKHAILWPDEDEAKRYMSRVDIVRNWVLGADAPRFIALMDEVDRVGWWEDPRAAESLFSEAFEIFRNAHRRYLESPEQAVVWKYELTSKGLRGPTIDEALHEAFIDDFLDGYCSVLVSLAERKPDSAAYAADRTREVEAYFDLLSRKAYACVAGPRIL